MMTTEDTQERRVPGNEDILAAIRTMMGTHVNEKHLDLEQGQIQTMVKEHRELYDEVAPLARDTNVKVTLLVDDMYGHPQPTAADPDAREGGWVPVLRAMQSDGVTIKRTWTGAQWLFYGSIGGAFISTCGVVIASILRV